jgi:multidrug efflux pump subunit AcrB
LRKIINACVRFRLLVVAVAAGVMVAGIFRLSQMPVDAVPQASAVAVDIETEAAGLSAPQVESLVTAPLEEHLRKHVPGVTDVASDSVAGLSAIELRFAPGTDPDHARGLVEEHLPRRIAAPGVSGASGASGAYEPVVLPTAPTASAVMLIGLTSGNLSLPDLSVLARAAIVPRLLALPGVGGVSVFGQAGPGLAVLADPARLAGRGVTLAQVLRTAGQAQPAPTGYTPTAATMARLPVAGTAGRLRLAQVALVVPGSQALTVAGGSPPSPALVLAVRKSPSAGVLTVSREVDQAIAAMRPQLPGVSIDGSLFREDTYLHSALANLRGALVASGVLAALALLALLLQLRLSCTALISMALSFVTATAVLAVAGYTFNALVTLGLLLALALVVTEAAGQAQAIAASVTGSAVTGRVETGRVETGRVETGSAVTGRTARLVAAACAAMRGTLTWAGLAALLCVVPLLLAAGLTASVLRPMAVAFALAVAVSLVVAVTVTPALAAVLLTVVPPQTRGRALPAVLADGYARLIAALARSRRAAAAGAVVSVAAGVAALAWLPFLHPGQPAFEDRALVVSLTGPPGMPVTAMNRLVALAASELSALPATDDVAATVGRAWPQGPSGPSGPSGQVAGTNTGLLWVTIKPDADYGQAVAAVQSIADGTPGLTGSVSSYENDTMGNALPGSPPEVVTRLYGGDYGELERLASRLRAVIADVGGVRGTRVLFPVGQPTATVDVNPRAAAKAGISPGDVRQSAAILLNGFTVGDYLGNQEVFDVLVEGTPAVRASPAAASGLELGTPGGGHVRLGQVARITVSQEPADIPRDAGSRYLDITALVATGQAGAVSAAIAGRLGAARFPPGYHAVLVTGTAAAGRGLAANEAVSGGSRAALVCYAAAALIGVLLIALGATGSWRLAMLAFGSLPVSLSGGVLVVFTVGVGGQLAASAGLLAALALAVRQAIAVTARAARGPDLGMILTPALITAVTLAPFVAMGNVPGMELPHTAAAVVLGGLFSTTLAGLFLLPVGCRRLRPRLTPDPAAVTAADGRSGQRGQRGQRVRARVVRGL